MIIMAANGMMNARNAGIFLYHDLAELFRIDIKFSFLGQRVTDRD